MLAGLSASVYMSDTSVAGNWQSCLAAKPCPCSLPPTQAEAASAGVAPSQLCSDFALWEITRRRPGERAALAACQGCSEFFVQKHGLVGGRGFAAAPAMGGFKVSGVECIPGQALTVCCVSTRPTAGLCGCGGGLLLQQPAPVPGLPAAAAAAAAAGRRRQRRALAAQAQRAGCWRGMQPGSSMPH